MTEMTRPEAERLLAEAEINSMDLDEIAESLKRIYMFGLEESVPYCDMLDNDITDEYEEIFGEVIAIV